MRSENRKFRSGVTLIELFVAMAISLILILVVGILLVGGQRAWQNTYDSAHKQIKEDAQAITITFGSMGRRSNRDYKPTDLANSGYVLYKVKGGVFTPALTVTNNSPEVVFGDAVEFRYWDVGLDQTDSYKLMDVTKPATAYALFYIDGGKLKVDYGPYPPGAVSAAGARNTPVTATVLAENVSAYPAGAFSHTTVSKVGQGSVKIDVTLTDPHDGQTINVVTATLLRVIWPR